MSKVRSVHDIHDHASAIKWASKKCARITEGSNHTKIEGPNGSTFLPRHPGDFKTGTKFAIIKQYIAIGLGIVTSGIILAALAF